MFEYSIDFDDGPINMDRIANSGQMFRWLVTDSGWEINDGGHQYSVGLLEGSRYHVEANADEHSFRRLFRTETRLEDILREIVVRGPELSEFIENRKGLRLMRPHGRTETLFSFLCSANNNVSRITKMVWNLASYGSGGFPSAEEIAAISEQTFRANGFGYRGATIPKVAQVIAANGGDRYLDQLARGDFESARQELIALPGVGKKLADCICLFALDHGESVPIDTHIWQVMTRLYFPHWIDSSLTDKKYEEIAAFFRDRFGELAGAAHQFLFVDNMERYRDRPRLLS